MPVPSILGTHSYRHPAGWSPNLTNSFDVGPDPVSLFALAQSAGGVSNTVRPGSLTLNGSIAMNAQTARGPGSEIGSTGWIRSYDLVASGLTGVVSYELLMELVSNGSPSGDAKPGILFFWVKDGVSATRTNFPGPVNVVGGSPLTMAVASNDSSLVAGIAFTDAGATPSFTGNSGTAVETPLLVQENFALVMSKVGASAGNTTLSATSASTTNHAGVVWSIQGDAGPPPSPELTLNTSLQAITSALSFQVVVPGSLTVTAALDLVTAALSFDVVAAQGRLVFPVAGRKTSQLWLNRNDLIVHVNNHDTNALVQTFTGVTTDGTGTIAPVQSSLIVSGQRYSVRVKIPPNSQLLNGAEGTWSYTAIPGV